MHLPLSFFVASFTALMLASAPAASADSRAMEVAPPPPAYADLVDLADGAPLVIRAQVQKIIAVEPARATSVKPGWVRLYVEARTETLIAGNRALGERISYLADVRPDARGKLPPIKKKSVILLARAVVGRPGEIQLVAPDAQIVWDAALEARIRAVLAELYGAGAPQRVIGVREALHVPGNLAGAGETQVFLGTAGGEPAALTITRQPDVAPRFGASFSELVGAGGGLPQRDTLGWYRLACFLPPQLPPAANIADSPADRIAAARDYAAAIAALGPCERRRP